MSTDFISSNLKDSLASIILLIGITFSFVSLIEKHRIHSEKLFALLFLAGISLFANDPICYFATLFIIATVVTNLDFLQNIAAIIKGSKEFFDYKTSTYNPKDKILQDIKSEELESEELESEELESEKLESEELESNESKSAMKENRGYKPVTIEFYSLAETLALNYFEKSVGKPIARNLLFRNKKMHIEIDGIIQQEHTDIIFEVKVIFKNKLYLRNITEYLARSTKILNSYKEITNRDASMKLVIVGNIDLENGNSLFNENVISNLKSSDNVSVEFISYNDIGLRWDESSIILDE